MGDFIRGVRSRERVVVATIQRVNDVRDWRDVNGDHLHVRVEHPACKGVFVIKAGCEDHDEVIKFLRAGAKENKMWLQVHDHSNIHHPVHFLTDNLA